MPAVLINNLPQITSNGLILCTTGLFQVDGGFEMKLGFDRFLDFRD